MSSSVKILLFFVFLTFISATLQGNARSRNPNNVETDHVREKRGLFFKPKKGIFGLMGQLIFEQWNDTKNTINTVKTLVNEQFVDENTLQQLDATTKKIEPNATTTEAPYRLTRTEFNGILQRNLRGLVKLFNKELQNAMNLSQTTYREFKTELSGVDPNRLRRQKLKKSPPKQP